MRLALNLNYSGANVALDIDIDGFAISRHVDFVRRLEAGKDLGAGRGAGAGLIRNAAVDVGVRLTGMLIERVAAELCADADVQRGGQTDGESPRQIEVRRQLLVAQGPGIEAGLIRGDTRSERGIQ